MFSTIGSKDLKKRLKKRILARRKKQRAGLDGKENAGPGKRRAAQQKRKKMRRGDYKDSGASPMTYESKKSPR